MKQEVTTQSLSIAEDYLHLLTLHSTLTKKPPKSWRSTQAGLNQDLAELTPLFQISVTTHIIKQFLLLSHLEFQPVYPYPIPDIFKTIPTPNGA